MKIIWRKNKTRNNTYNRVCPKYEVLGEKSKTMADHHGFEIEIVKIADLNKIIECGVMMTPGLVINGEVKAAGKIPSDEDLLRLLS